MKVLGNTKVSLFEFMYFLCMVFYAGNASTFARDLNFVGQLGNTVALVITALFVIVKKIKFDKRLFTISIVFLIYAILNFAFNRYISFGFLLQWLVFFILAYVICVAYKERFFYVYETSMLALCIISLFFWIIYLMFPEQLVAFMYRHQFSSVFNEMRPTVNILVYSVNTRLDYEEVADFLFFRRNAGFAWEPGAFACYICFAIFCNILRNGIKFKKNIPLWIFLFTLLSTESTTGFFILAVMYFFAFMISKEKRRGALIILPIVGLLVLGLPFVADKFIQELSMVNQINLWEIDEGGYGRLFSFKLAFMEFLHNPIFGSGNSSNTLLNEMGYDLSIFSGIGNLLSNFGIIMTIGFFILVKISARYICKVFNTNFGKLLWIPLIGLMISYNVWNTPIIMFYWLYGYFCEPSIEKKYA